MKNLSTIEIDLDIHKMIEGERRSFEEPRYLALRRLLGLPDNKIAEPKFANSDRGRPFIQDGVEVPHGSLARMEYLRGAQVYEGQFLDGKLVVNGTEYDSLSAAAMGCAVTKEGTKCALNGWLYWMAQFPGEADWKRLHDLREDVRKASM